MPDSITSRVNQTRITNLRNLTETHGGVNKFAAKLGYTNGSYLSTMTGPNPTRPISERVVRKIEQALGLSDGFLDREDVAKAPAPAIDHSLVTQALQSVAGAIEAAGLQVSPVKLGKIASMVYLDAVDHGGIRQSFIDELVALATR